MPVLNRDSSPPDAAPVTEPDPGTFEMDDSALTVNEEDRKPQDEPAKPRMAGVARHTLGLILLLCVVFLWTLSNFLGSVCISGPGKIARPG